MVVSWWIVFLGAVEAHIQLSTLPFVGFHKNICLSNTCIYTIVLQFGGALSIVEPYDGFDKIHFSQCRHIRFHSWFSVRLYWLWFITSMHLVEKFMSASTLVRYKTLHGVESLYRYCESTWPSGYSVGLLRSKRLGFDSQLLVMSRGVWQISQLRMPLSTLVQLVPGVTKIWIVMLGIAAENAPHYLQTRWDPQKECVPIPGVWLYSPLN